MTQLTHQLDRRFPIAVVRLTGALTAGTGPSVRAAVSESLVEEPSSVIVDLAGVSAVDEFAARTLSRLAAQAAQWPGSVLRLCGPSATVADAVRDSHVDGSLTVHPDFSTALAAAAAEPLPLRMHRRLESTVHAPRAGRELAVDACTEWGLPGYLIAAEILASELVTNAVRHAGTVMDLRITLRDGQLRVSVQDRSTRAARLQTPASSDDHGRGLLIVGSVASQWGSQQIADGKVVWASLNVTPGSPPRPGNGGPPDRKSG